MNSNGDSQGYPRCQKMRTPVARRCGRARDEQTPRHQSAASRGRARGARLWAAYLAFYEVTIPEDATRSSWDRILRREGPMFGRILSFSPPLAAPASPERCSTISSLSAGSAAGVRSTGIAALATRKPASCTTATRSRRLRAIQAHDPAVRCVAAGDISFFERNARIYPDIACAESRLDVPECAFGIALCPVAEKAGAWKLRFLTRRKELPSQGAGCWAH